MKNKEFYNIDNKFIERLQAAKTTKECVKARTAYFNELIATGKPLTDRQAETAAVATYYFTKHFETLIKERADNERA